MVTVAAGGAKSWHHLDGLGSGIALSGTGGVVSERHAYGPYGEEAGLTGSALRFAGRRLDAETGLYHNRARTYAPALGRFLQPDPIGYQGGLNLYAYVGNDPLNLVDPMGTKAEPAERLAVRVHLRGLGETFLDSEFAGMINNFDAEAQSRGVTIQYTSGYRSPQNQAALRASGSNVVVTPASQSLHSAGLAVDVRYLSLPAEQQAIIRSAATSAGLEWGGSFRTPDPVHFYYDPGGDRATLINSFTEDVNRSQYP